MELAPIIETLIERRKAVAVVVVLAALLAVLSGYRPTTSGLEKRSIEFGAANAQLLIDSPKSALADLTQDTTPLATRAAVFAQFMRSTAVKESISRATGIPTDKLTTTGPFSDVGERPAIVSETAQPEGSQGYRLVFDTQPELPVINVYAQAPTAREAVGLADGAVNGVREYVERLQNDDALPVDDRVQIRALGPAQGGPVNSGASKAVMVFAFFAVLIVGCVAIVGGGRVASSLRVAGSFRRADEDRGSGAELADWNDRGFDAAASEPDDLPADGAGDEAPPQQTKAAREHGLSLRRVSQRTR